LNVTNIEETVAAVGDETKKIKTHSSKESR